MRTATKHIALCLAGLLLCGGLSCVNTKKSTNAGHSMQDSARQIIKHSDSGDHSSHVSDKQQRNTFESHKEEKRDTAIGIKAVHVAGNFSATDIGVTNGSGRKVPQRFWERRDGVMAWVNIDTNGHVDYGCDADSLTFVLRSLQSIHDSSTAYQRYEYDSLATEYKKLLDSSAARASRRDSTATSTTITKTQTIWGRYWWLILLCGIALVLGVLRKFGAI